MMTTWTDEEKRHIAARVEKGLIEQDIPPYMHGAVRRYIYQGISMGSFGRALFENDFIRTIDKSDGSNRMALVNWARFIYNDVPHHCHGSPERVKAWINHGGLNYIPEE